MREDYINNNKIKENKYKILRMSLILGSDDDREETINNFEEAARDVDAMNDETYLKELESKFYDTLKLEEEEEKLAALVDYIGGRVEQRISLLSDFANITGYDLTNLPPIKYYDKLDDYKERLKYIREYLSNTEQITQISLEIEESEAKLKEAYLNKAASEEANERNEEMLLSKFTNIINKIEELRDITKENIDAKLNEIIFSAEESKKSLDIFMKSYTTLRGSGISYEEEVEYKSYVDNTKELYYSSKEQEYLLKIYNLLFTKEVEYNKITIKRNLINDILEEREELRSELDIQDNDIMSSVYELLERQYLDIQQQKNNIESIEYLTSLISQRTLEKNELEEANQKVEILSLLREFCIIDTYVGMEVQTTTDDAQDLSLESQESNLEINDISQPEGVLESGELIIPTDLFDTNTDILNPSAQSSIPEGEIKENQVIAIEPAIGLDIELIQSKASKVMKRVGEMLGIKTEETKVISVTNDEEKTSQEIPISISEATIPTTQDTSIPEPSNPLFGDEVPTNTEQPVEEEPVDPEDDSSFWFPSDMPDALNELPDLDVTTNNLFGDNNISELQFPDLNLNFSANDTEGN